MQVFALLPLLTTFAATTAGVSAALVGSAGPITCTDETVAHESFIGKDANVKLQLSHCANAPHVSASGNVLAARQSSSNVCGAPCTSVPRSSYGGTR